MAGFAVVDVETTGFNARGDDRIVELAVVHADEFGRVTGQWTTMVNPHRDLGESGLHGLREAEIVGAPGFSEIAESLGGLLRGRILVAHNARFAGGFLEAEFKRAGREMLGGAVPPAKLRFERAAFECVALQGEANSVRMVPVHV